MHRLRYVPRQNFACITSIHILFLTFDLTPPTLVVLDYDSKKSDPSRPPPVLHSSSFPHSSEDEHFPGLPSADAFRTSLILPECVSC